MTTLPVQLLRQDRPFAYFMRGDQKVDIYPTDEFLTAFNNAVERLGGQTGDSVALALSRAMSALKAAKAVGNAVPLPEVSGITLNPSQPLTVYDLSDTQTRIYVAGHTRSGAAAPIVAGYVDVARGPANTESLTYYVYYVDAGSLGGAVTFLATTVEATAKGAGCRVVGIQAVSSPISRFNGIVDREISLL